MNGVVLGLLLAQTIGLEEVRQWSKDQLQAVQARLDVERAETVQKQARSAILPSVDLSLNARASFNGPRQQINPFTQQTIDQQAFLLPELGLGLTVQQLLYDGGKWWSAIAQAGAQAEATRGQLQEQRLASELEAVRRYYELVRAQMTRRTLESTLERSRTQLERATSLYEAGRVQRRDVLDAEVNVGNDEIAIVRQEQNTVVARAELLRWLAQPMRPVRAIEPDEMISSMPVPDAEALLTRAKAERPLTKALAQRVRAAELGVDIASSDNLPRIGLELGYNRGSPSAEAFFRPQYQNVVSGGVRLSWNLFRGLETQALTERARVDVDVQRSALAQALVDLEAELTQVREGVLAQQTIAKIAERNVMLATAQLSMEEERYSAGAGTSIEVRTAQLKLLQAQLTRLQGYVDYEIAVAALERAIGQRLERGG